MRAVLAVAVLACLVFLVLQSRPQRKPEVRVPETAGSTREDESAKDLSLLVITLDTTRADRLGAYGYRGIETPHLDALAREGAVFEYAESVAPLTLPAHSSIFTGLFPPNHGVRDNGGYYLDDKRVLLAEVLRDAGFRTGGFIGAFVLDSKWGIAQGFDTYFDDFDLKRTSGRSLDEIQRPAGEVADAALSWLDEAPRARFFAWVHFYDPHSPYRPPEPWATRYADHPYAGEIAYVDSQVGRLLDWLDRNDRARNTVVMVMGDHGESLGEHGESGHGFFVYEAATRVPFIVRAPSSVVRGHRIDTPVRSIDLMPTALELLGIDAPAEMDGVSLVPLLDGRLQAMNLTCYSEAVYPRYHFGWSDLAAVRVGDLKYIDAPRPELYDLAVDPNEEHDLCRERSDDAHRLKEQLTELESGWRGATPSRPAEEIDPDTRARLAALGYLGNRVSAGDGPAERSSLADPKDKIRLYNLMGESREASLNDDSERAVKALQQVLAEDPSVVDAWVRLGNEQRRLKRVDAAIRSYKRALDLDPQSELAVIDLAHAYRAVGKDEEAILGFEKFLGLDPRNEQVHYELAQMLIDRGRLDEADRHLQEAIRLAPEMAAAANARAVIAFRHGDPGTAERLIGEALEIKSDVRLAHFNLALIAEGRGDLRSAEQHYREELELYPDSYKVDFNLGRVLGATGDGEGQIAAFRKALEINSDFAEGYFFLAKALLDSGGDLQRVIELARAGLERGPTPQMAPMGHYLLADAYTRLGRARDAGIEAAKGRALEKGL